MALKSDFPEQSSSIKHFEKIVCSIEDKSLMIYTTLNDNSFLKNLETLEYASKDELQSLFKKIAACLAKTEKLFRMMMSISPREGQLEFFTLANSIDTCLGTIVIILKQVNLLATSQKQSQDRDTNIVYMSKYRR